MRRKLSVIVALAMATAMCFTACGSAAPAATAEPAAPAETKEEAPADDAAPAEDAGEVADAITLWTYPIGGWGNEETVKTLTDMFEQETGIAVTVEYLTYQDGDDKVNTAIEANKAPDLIMEGPERLVANWGRKGFMVDLSDILTADDEAAINPSVVKACKDTDGKIYEYPLVMTAHCMAVNVDAFKEAGADQYLDLETHTWTTEDFKAAVAALYEKYGQTVGAVYCAGQGGDQGTRALINNMYGGTFTNADHTAYTWDDAANIKALEELSKMDGIAFDPSLVGGDEIALFYNETLKMAFCWNIAQQLNPNSADTGAGLTINGQEIAFMGFPSESGKPELCGGIWGFGIFNNGDDAKIAAAKQFIQFMCNSEYTADAVMAANYFAVRDTAGGQDISGIWNDQPIMSDYNVLMPYLGDYYQVTAGWADARTAWWNMLQKVGSTGDVQGSVDEFLSQANEAAAK